MTWVKNYWSTVVTIIIASIAVIALIAMFMPIGLFWWNYSEFETALYNELGFNIYWAKVFAVLLGIAFALTLPISARWLLLGQRREKAIAAAAFVFVTPPILHALFETPISRTGAAQSCYEWTQNDQLVVIPAANGECGIDPNSGQQQHLFTPEVAAIMERMKEGIHPEPIETCVSQIDFFDSVTGHPRVWYERTTDGKIKLYDAEGFSPKDGSLLRPVTPDIVNELVSNRRAGDGPACKAAVLKRSNFSITPLAGLSVASADFSNPSIASRNMQIIPGFAFAYNNRYPGAVGGTWRITAAGGGFSGTFTVLKDGQYVLVVAHLTSSLPPNPGYSPVTISVNSEPVVQGFDPKSHHPGVRGILTDRWPIFAHAGENTISWTYGTDGLSHYWIHSIKIQSE